MSLIMSTAVSLIAVILGTVDCLEPELRVNPTVISVRQSVRLSCEPPQGLHGPQNKCSFLIYAGSVSEDSDCEVSFTGAELIRLGNDGPESEILISCVYTLDTGDPSLLSVPVKVTVTDLKPELRVNPTVISVTQSVHLTCEPPQGLHEPQTKCTFLAHEYSLIKDSDCEVSFTGAELIRLRGFKPESEILISCVYTLDTGDPSLLSAAVRVTVTEKEPTPTTSSLPPPENYVVPLVITAVLVTLLAFAVVYLFRLRRKKNLPSEEEAPPPSNMYYEVVPMGESKKPEEAGSKSARNEFYSMIGDNSSAVPPLPPTGCDAKPEQRNNNKTNPDNIYFIIEDPRAPIQGGMIYSTVAMH